MCPLSFCEGHWRLPPNPVMFKQISHPCVCSLVHICCTYIYINNHIYIHYTYARHIVLLQAMFLFLLWSLRRCRLHLYYSCFLVVSPCFAGRSVQLTYSDPPCEHGFVQELDAPNGSKISFLHHPFPNIWLKMNQVTCFYGSLWRISPYPAIKRGRKFPHLWRIFPAITLKTPVGWWLVWGLYYPLYIGGL